MKPIAEFSQTYREGLRSYPIQKTPSDFVRPIATIQARSIAKTSSAFGDSPIKNPYLRS